MRLRHAVFVCLLLSLLWIPPSVLAQEVACDNFDSWIWAQTVYETNPEHYSPALDPDGNDLACETKLIRAFSPVLWTDAIPSGAEAAQVTGIIDGDTFDVTVNGVADRVRMYHIDAPETSFEEQCGGTGATDYLAFVMHYAPNATVYLEYDESQRDDFDRRLAYVWYQIGSDVYLVNEVMVRGGWADSQAFRPDVKYSDELNAAEDFSVDHVLGVRFECGRFNRPPGSKPSDEQMRQAMRRQPNQGQFPDDPSIPETPAPVTEVPPDPVPTSAPEPPPPTGECDPSYPGVCIPPASQVGDLDCADVGYRRFTVIPPDPHNFDGDFDGVGCESG